MTTETLYSSNPRRERRLRTKLGDGRGRTRRRRERVMRQFRDVIAWSSFHRNSFHLLSACSSLTVCWSLAVKTCPAHHIISVCFITSSKNIKIKNVCFFCFCFCCCFFFGGRQSMPCKCLATLPFRHPLSTWNSASKLCRETKDVDDRPD